MKVESYIDSSTGVLVTRVPASMTGKKYRKLTGQEITTPPKSKKGFKVSAKFRGVPVAKRLRFLKKMATIVRKDTKPDSFDLLRTKRKQFNSHKFKSLPIGEKQVCYVCVKVLADIRHHVITMQNGGRNKRNNIVPLCNSCHSLVHPHMMNRRNKKKCEGSFPALRTALINGPVVVNPPKAPSEVSLF